MSPTRFAPKRGRPDAKQTAAIEAAILDTAGRMFLDQGFDAVPMEAIAAETGVSKGTLYARHPTKEALFDAVVRARIAEWSRRAGADDHLLTDDIAQRLHHHGRTIARSLADPEIVAFRRLLFAQSDRFPALARSMYDAGYRYIRELLAEDIAAAARRDGIGVTDPADVAARLIGTITGWALQEGAVRDIPVDELIGFAGRTVDLLIAARPRW